MERNTLEVSTPTNRKDHPERSGFFLSKISCIRGFGKFVWHLSYTTNHLESGTWTIIVWHLSYTTLVLHASKHSGLPVLSTTGLRAREVLHRDESEKFLHKNLTKKDKIILLVMKLNVYLCSNKNLNHEQRKSNRISKRSNL